MIAYHILCHGNFKQVALLIDSLYTREDTFLIDIDDGQKPDTRALKKFAGLDNVEIVRDSNIGWGAGGTLRKTLKGAFRLLASGNWRYYVVLSGQDLPLKSNDHIKNRLSRGEADKTNFIRVSPALPVDMASVPINNKSGKVVMLGDRGHTKVFARPDTIDPQVAFGARWRVDVTEVADRGEVYIGTADPLLMRFRESFFEKYPFYVGANWFNLHRSLVEYMYKDPFTYELYEVLRTTFIPDESYFQTYLKNSPFRNRISCDYGRLILRPGPIPRVKVFDVDDWREIETSDALYGRKFDINRDKKVVRQVLESRAA